MKILVLSQYFHPENFRINDICLELVKKGHQVNVLTGLPDYKSGQVPKEYKHFRNRKENWHGVKIARVPIIARRTGTFFRLLNYCSYVATSCTYALFHKKEECDAIFVYQTSPVFQAIAGIIYKAKFKKKLVLYCCDIWPECVKAWNIGENKYIFRMVKKISSWIYNKCDSICITSKPFKKYLHEVCGVPLNKITYLPQHAEDIYSTYRGQYIDNNCIDFVFAGNIGAVQDIQCIIRACKRIQPTENYCVHIVGDGSELENCKRLVNELQLEDKIIFCGRHPIEEMPRFYKLADCFLLTLKGDTSIGLTLPAKRQGYLSAGKPIIWAVEGAAYDVIWEAEGGVAVSSGDDLALSQAMLDVIRNPSLYRNKGEKGSQYYTTHFSKDVFIMSLLKVLK